MTVAITPPMKSPALVSISAAVPLDLNTCRRDIERAATIKVCPKTASLTIRECLLSVGLSPCQASNRTMQARVRREVKHLISGSTRKVPWGEKSRPPFEITIRILTPVTSASISSTTASGAAASASGTRTISATTSTVVLNDRSSAASSSNVRESAVDDDFDSQVNELFQEADEVSLLSEPTCFLPPQQQQQQQQQLPPPQQQQQQHQQPSQFQERQQQLMSPHRIFHNNTNNNNNDNNDFHLNLMEVTAQLPLDNNNNNVHPQNLALLSVPLLNTGHGHL